MKRRGDAVGELFQDHEVFEGGGTNSCVGVIGCEQVLMLRAIIVRELSTFLAPRSPGAVQMAEPGVPKGCLFEGRVPMIYSRRI